MIEEIVEKNMNSHNTISKQSVINRKSLWHLVLIGKFDSNNRIKICAQEYKYIRMFINEINK